MYLNNMYNIYCKLEIMLSRALNYTITQKGNWLMARGNENVSQENLTYELCLFFGSYLHNYVKAHIVMKPAVKQGAQTQLMSIKMKLFFMSCLLFQSHFHYMFSCWRFNKCSTYILPLSNIKVNHTALSLYLLTHFQTNYSAIKSDERFVCNLK